MSPLLIQIPGVNPVRAFQHPQTQEWGISVSDISTIMSPVSAGLGVRPERAKQFKMFRTSSRGLCVPIEQINPFLDSRRYYKKEATWKLFREILHATAVQQIKTYLASPQETALTLAPSPVKVKPLPPAEVFKSLLDSTEQFPVDFDDAWQWAGYSRKDNGLKVLTDNFLSGSEFSLEFRKTGSPEGGRPFQQIKLTIDCFKAFCLMANTEQGKKVRRYFIDIEAQYHKERPRQETGIVITNDPDADLKQVMAVTASLIATRQEVRQLEAQAKALQQKQHEQTLQLREQADLIHGIFEDVNEQGVKLINVEGKTRNLEIITAEFKKRQEEAEAEMNGFPPATFPVNERTVRSNLVELVRAFATINSLPHNDCWAKLYREFRYRYNTDLIARGKHVGKRPLDIAEEITGAIDALYALACELFKLTKKLK